MTDQQIFEIAQGLWSAYFEAVKNYKAVKAETGDGSEDWQEFHEVRLTNAQAENDRTFDLYTGFRKHFEKDLDRITAEMLGG